MNVDPLDRVGVWGASATIDQRLSDYATSKSISAHRAFAVDGQ